MNTVRRIAAFVLLSCSAALAQPKTVSIEQLPLDSTQPWQYPRFSPNGKHVYFTTSRFHGIWEYSTETRRTRQVAKDPQSGFNFSISDDGLQISYRRASFNAALHRETEEIVIQDLKTGTGQILAAGKGISTPVFVEKQVVYSIDSRLPQLTFPSPGRLFLLGTENSKISLLLGGSRVLLDPIASGHYIWPALSPDRKWIVAYEIDRGAFVCTTGGDNVTMLGRRDGATWTRDGSWIVFMDDHDDGHQILSSEIACVSPDGKRTVTLTSTPDIIELNPQCSPGENKIVYHTLDGRIFLLTYSD